MAEIVQLSGDNDVEYVLSNPNYVLQAADSQNIICNDAGFLFNGALNNTIVLQQLDNSVYVNSDELLLSETEETEYVINDGEPQYIQYVEDGIQHVGERSSSQQLVYIANDNELNELTPANYNSLQIVQDNNDSSEPIQNFIAQVIDNPNNYQFAILDDGQFQVENFTETLYQDHQQPAKSMDVSEITGKNLITGQTVHLNSYINNKNKRLTEDPDAYEEYETKSSSPLKREVRDLLNKEIPLVKKVNGKKIVGRIVQVSNADGKLEESPNTTTTPSVDNEINNQYVDLISRTLSGLMEMDSVKKKLQNAYLLLRVVLRKYYANNSFSKKISYMKGFMNKVCYVGETVTVRWEFVTHEGLERCDYQQVTIFIKESSKGKRKIRVVLGDNQYNSQCDLCLAYFQTKSDLQSHIKQMHGKLCVLCKGVFTSTAAFNEHQKEHVEDGQLLECEMCKKTFRTHSKLRRHYSVHKSAAYECNLCHIQLPNETTFRKHSYIHMQTKMFNCFVCDKSYSSQGEFKAHVRTHDEAYKSRFSCNVCGRTFSRQSNLQRHVAIHVGAGAHHTCQICGCSYHFASSLTRHMIQYHINVLSRS